MIFRTFRELEDIDSMMGKADLNLRSMIDEEKKEDTLSDMSSKDLPVSSQNETKGGFTPGKFYFEDMLSEYERTIDRNNNEKIGNIMKTNQSKQKYSELGRDISWKFIFSWEFI